MPDGAGSVAPGAPLESPRLPLIHLPLCAFYPRLQQLLVDDVRGDAYHRVDGTESVDPTAKGAPIVMQYLHVSDALQSPSRVPPLLVCPPDCYLQQLCVAERIRMLPLFQICLSIASELQHSLRVLIVAVHRHARWRSVLPLFQMVPLAAAAALPVPLPARTAVYGPHADVIVGRRGDVGFQSLSAMVDALLAVFTVLTLLGWADPEQHVSVGYRTAEDGTLLLLGQVPREAGCSGPRLSLWDEERDLTVVHRTGHHLELVIVTLNQIVVQVQCGDCGSSFALFRPHLRCPRCGAEVVACLQRQQSVLLRLTATARDLR